MTEVVDGGGGAPDKAGSKAAAGAAEPERGGRKEKGLKYSIFWNVMFFVAIAGRIAEKPAKVEAP